MKRLVLILSLICLTIPGLAEQISRDQALRIAQQFLSQKGLPSSVKAAETALSRRRAQGIIQPDYYYVFNNGQNQGFVIVSGDDRAETVLGYATSGSFDVDNIPSNMAAWLQGYADQIKYIQDNNIQPRQNSIRRGSPAVSGLVTSKWNQGEPYNLNCPKVGTEKCVTGCVTTAVSQILYHYSKSGFQPSSTAIPGYTTTINGITLPALDPTSFEWSSMKDVYDGSETSEQKNAIAKLFEYVGTGLVADYDLAAKGGTPVRDDKPEIVFRNYFGYGNGIQLVSRMDATPNDEWDNLIYNEISNGRPVLYSGQGSGGGHSFIVHGYDGAGKYLINWGWGGFQDGYFALSALDPDGGGAGAGSGGYNYGQTALVGISPTDVTPYQISETVVLTTDYIELPAGDNIYTIPAGHSQFGPVTIYARYKSELSSAYNIEYNYKILKNGEFLEYLFKTSPGFSSFGPGYYFPYNTSASRLDEMSFYLPDGDSYSSTLGLSFKEPGTYKMIPVSREAGTSEWNENIGSDTYYLTGVVSSDMKLKMYVGEPGGSDPTPEVSQAELDALAALYAAQKNAINAKITAIETNNAKLASISTAISDIYNALTTVNTKITALESKLNSEYLTAKQKQTYNNQLATLKSTESTLTTSLTAASDKLSSLQATSNSLKSSLNTLLASVDTEAAVVASITTKAALETSTAKVNEITSQQNACDVSAETTKVASLETEVAAISITSLQTDLTALETTIDAAIEAGKAANDEEAQKQFEADKKALLDTFPQLLADVDSKLDAVATNEKTILELEASIQDAKDAIEPIEKKIAAIKESLKSEMLTVEQKTAFEGTLATLEKAKSAYAEAVNTQATQLALVKKTNDAMKSQLQELKTDLQTQQSNANNATTPAALTEIKNKTNSDKDQLQAISVADVEKQVLEVQAGLSSLSLDATTKNLAALEDDVEKAIAGGQEEYEKQQAEKLAKAQETFKAAVDALDETIKAQEADYNKCLEVMENIKAKMAELNDAISQLKAQYAEIEKKLQEFIDKQSTTRSDDSEVIENLQKKLAELKENIETLESQNQLIAGQIEKLDQQAKDYAAVIAAAKTSRQTLQDGLSSALTADEVDKLTASVTKVKSALASEGVDYYNLLAGNCNAVTKNVNTVVDNVNIVDNQVQSLENEVEQTITAINQLIIDESEVVARYDMKGNPVDSTYKGMQIIRLKNGKTIKLNVK